MEELVKAMDAHIAAIHRAFGAPGDYGYETLQGRTLYSLYKFQTKLRAFLAKSAPSAEADS